MNHIDIYVYEALSYSYIAFNLRQERFNDVAVRQARPVGREGSHLKLLLQAGANTFDAIAFRQGYWLEDMPDLIDIAYRFEENEYMGRSSLQLNIKDIKAAGFEE